MQRELERLAHGKDQHVNDLIAIFAQGLNDDIMRDVQNWEMRFQQFIDTLDSEKDRIGNETGDQDAERARVAGDAPDAGGDGDCQAGDRPEHVGHRPAPRRMSPDAKVSEALRLQETPMHDTDPGEDGDPRTATFTWSSGALRRAARKLGLEDIVWLGRSKRDLARLVARAACMKHG